MITDSLSEHECVLVQIETVSGSSAKISIKTLAAGNYVMKVYTSIGTATKKLIINR